MTVLLSGARSPLGADAAGAIAAGARLAPYLALLCERRPEICTALAEHGPDLAFATALGDMRAAGEIPAASDAVRALRRAKEGAHLAIAGADLAQSWSLDQTVEALSTLADAAVASALRIALRSPALASRLPAEVSQAGVLPGYFILAMGKLGARELNYSSDIDLIALFDPDRLPLEPAQAKETVVRVTREIVRLLEERTADGYVFRTDLRLRPDPGSTAVAISTAFALVYYESDGQNWERMAHIKARVCAGDAVAGDTYLADLQSYLWRRHLDYWAIADIHSIKRQIHSHGGHASLEAAEFDVKLGRGGVREIEFFAQVQQLILGGRQPELRAAGTKAALRALTAAGVVDRETASDLIAAYDHLRSIEHRIQMLNDEQTHFLPATIEKRGKISQLAGYADLAAFERDIAAVRRIVHAVYSDLFAQEERLSGETGNLVFTGVDDDPDTVRTLAGMGFSSPGKVIETLRGWHRGGVAAARSARGRQLLTILGPRLLEAMSQAGEPDVAFDRFAEFFSALRGGVQTMSLMLAEPSLTRDIIETMAYAPRLADELARRPALFDAMIDPSFTPLVSDDPPGAREQRLRAALEREDAFEGVLNAARRFHREEAFRIGWQLLRGRIHAKEAGAAYADLADSCVRTLAAHAERDVLSRYEGEIGRWCVCGLGSFGGRDLSATSDLDLMLVYEPPADASRDPLAARFVQRLIAALSAQTEEGALYTVDTQLRPSGRAGPVAVKLSAFEAYYQTDAWTWEFMALSRLRPVAGDAELSGRIDAIRRAALIRKSADPTLTADIADMRARLLRERPPRSTWDLKLTPGGLMDAEFLIEHGVLASASKCAEALTPELPVALGALADVGWFSPGEASLLSGAMTLMRDLRQALRIAARDGQDPHEASAGAQRWLARLCGAENFDALDRRLTLLQAEVLALRKRKLPFATTDEGAPAV